MAYIRYYAGGWENEQSGETPITADALNHIELGILNIEARTINGKAFNSNITLTNSDIGSVPTSRTINGKALTANITLNADDVGAMPSSGGTSSGTIIIKNSDADYTASSLSESTAKYFSVRDKNNNSYGFLHVTQNTDGSVTTGLCARHNTNGANVDSTFRLTSDASGVKTSRLNAGTLTTSGSIWPSSTDTYNLGGTSARWNNLYAAGVRADTGIFGGYIRPATDDLYDLGSSSYHWRNVYTNKINGYSPVSVITKTVSGTTTAAGNISLGIGSDTHGILSVQRTDANGICTPFVLNGTWYAHITNYAATPTTVASTGVALTVDYYLK